MTLLAAVEGAWAFAAVVATGVFGLVGARLNRPAAERRAAAVADERVCRLRDEIAGLDDRLARTERWAADADARAARAETRAARAETRADELERRAHEADGRADAAERRAELCDAVTARQAVEIAGLKLVLEELRSRLAVLVAAVEAQLPGLDVERLLVADTVDPVEPEEGP